MGQRRRVARLLAGGVRSDGGSADYDGDQGRLGKSFGVKQADPNMRMVMGGLSGKYPTSTWPASITSYLDGVRTWAQTNRAGSFPADVINVHHYLRSGPSSAAVSPTVTDWGRGRDEAEIDRVPHDQNLPGKEVWITVGSLLDNTVSDARPPSS